MFGVIADATRGRVTRHLAGVPAGGDTGIHVIAGDADDSGCVDSADYNVVRQFFGQAVNHNVPQTFAADLNRDGIVDSRDYTLLSTQFGQGCTSSPGPVPKLQGVLLGFDSAADWSSPQTTLVNTSIHKTQGAYALSVGGHNWREISTAPFNTSTFQNVTSKIAYDIFVPPNPSNPFWLGQTLMFVSCPSAGINNVSLGAVELTGKPLNAFSTAQFNLPANVKNAMLSSHNDFSIKVVVNANDSGYLLDNIHFVP
jgi:hypothetical protein